MVSELIIGHYGKNAYCGFDETLKELNVSNFLSVVEETEVCPYKPLDSGYKQWKQTNNHLLFFTLMDKRPPKDGSKYNPSGFATIDIDHSDTTFTVEHPSVWGINKTPGGTHIIIYGVFGKTPSDWQHRYLCIAREVLTELKSKYGSELRLDGTSAKYTQGCFLWNSKWDFSNPNLDLTYKAENRAFGNEDIDDMFEKKLVDGKWVQSFAWEKCNTAYNPAAKNAKGKTIVSTENKNETDTLNLASEIGIDKTMRGDLFSLDRIEWIRKYEQKYKFISEAPTKYNVIPNYRGDWVEMAFLDGQHPRLWLPIPLWNKDGVDVGGKRPRGTRIKSTHRHLKQLARLMDECMDGADPNQMLFNAVYYVSNFCENGLVKSKDKGYDVTNSEILRCVVSAYNTYKDDEDDILFREKSLFKCGNEFIDGSTGEAVRLISGDPSTRGRKIALNAFQRKTLRIETAMDMFDPSATIEDNCSRIGEYSRLEGLTVRTLKEYIRLAKGMDWVVNKHSWVKDYDIGDGRKTRLAIRDKRNGKVMVFKTVKECLERLKWSKPTYYKFLRGKSKYNKIYTLISENQSDKP